MRLDGLPRRIQRTDDLANFSCGRPSLDGWLRDHALSNDANDGTKVFVVTVSRAVVGYYGLASGAVLRATVPNSISKNMPNPVPVMVLGRLAVDAKAKGLGLGTKLLADAMGRVAAVSEQVAVKALQVHAADDEAAGFYLHHGFVPSPTDPLHLMLSIKTIRAYVEGSTPLV